MGSLFPKLSAKNWAELPQSQMWLQLVGSGELRRYIQVFILLNQEEHLYIPMRFVTLHFDFGFRCFSPERFTDRVSSPENPEPRTTQQNKTKKII